MLKSLASRVSFWHRALFVGLGCRESRGRGGGSWRNHEYRPGSRGRRGPKPLPLTCRLCGATHAPAPVAVCEECLGPLEPAYDPDRPLPDAATIATRPASLWRYREWLPFEGEPTALARQRLHPAGRVAGTGSPHRRRTPLAQERRGVASLPLVQGPRSRLGDQRRASARAGHGRLRVDRESGERGRRPGRARRNSRLDLHPARSRAGQGRGHRGLRPAPGTGTRHLRRCEPALRPGGRPLRLGARQHQPPELLRRGLEDGRLRDCRAAGLAAADRRRGPHGRAARWSPSWGRASASSPTPG